MVLTPRVLGVGQRGSSRREQLFPSHVEESVLHMCQSAGARRWADAKPIRPDTSWFSRRTRAKPARVRWRALREPDQDVPLAPYADPEVASPRRLWALSWAVRCTWPRGSAERASTSESPPKQLSGVGRLRSCAG